MTNEKLDDCCAMAVVHQVYPVPGTDAIDCIKSNRLHQIDLPNRLHQIDLPNRRLTD